MSMLTYVNGIKPPDETWKKMKVAYDACENAGISIPSEVEDYFDGEKPDEKGVVVSLSLDKHPCIEEYSDDSQQGYELDLTKLPSDIKILRFVNSW